MWFVYVLPFLGIGIFVFFCIYYSHSDWQRFKNDKDKTNRQSELSALRNGEVRQQSNEVIDDKMRDILYNSMWKEIEAVNAEYDKYNFNQIKCDVALDYTKYTSSTNYNGGFDSKKYLIGVIFEELPKYKEIIEEYIDIYKVYAVYEEKVNAIYNEKRLYKNIETSPKDDRTWLSKKFGMTERERFEKLQMYEEETFLRKTFRPNFPHITLQLVGRGMYQKKFLTFRFDQIIEFYNTAVDKQGKLSFIKKERAKVSDDMRYNVLKRDGFRCCICGATADDGVKLEVDHIIPVSKGGKSTYDNLQTLCERCNRGKRDK